MKRKSIISLISLLSFALLVLSGCKGNNYYDRVEINSVSVESLNMNGLRALDVVLAVEVENSAGKIVIKDAKVVLKHSGKVLGNVNVAPLTLAARTTADYKVVATLELDRGVNVMHLMSLMDVRKLNECTVDLSFKGKAPGIIIKREFKDIPMKELLEELL